MGGKRWMKKQSVGRDLRKLRHFHAQMHDEWLVCHVGIFGPDLTHVRSVERRRDELALDKVVQASGWNLFQRAAPGNSAAALKGDRELEGRGSVETHVGAPLIVDLVDPAACVNPLAGSSLHEQDGGLPSQLRRPVAVGGEFIPNRQPSLAAVRLRAHHERVVRFNLAHGAQGWSRKAILDQGQLTADANQTQEVPERGLSRTAPPTDHSPSIGLLAVLDVLEHPSVQPARALVRIAGAPVTDDFDRERPKPWIQRGSIRRQIDELGYCRLERHAPPEADAWQELGDGWAIWLELGRWAQLHPPTSLDERAERGDRWRANIAASFDVERPVGGSYHHEFAPPVSLVGLAKEPLGALVSATMRSVACKLRHVLEFDEVPHLQVRKGQAWLALYGLGLERPSVGFNDAQVQHDPVRRIHLAFGRDGFLRLQLLNLVLEHLARAVAVYPNRRVIENPRGRAVHMMAGFLPILVVPNHGTSVPAKRLDVCRSLDQVDCRAECVAVGARLQRGREGATKSDWVASCVRAVSEAKTSLRVQRLLSKSLLKRLRGGAHVAGPSQDVRDTSRKLFSVGATRLEPPKFFERGSVVVAREGTVEINLGVRIEQPDARRNDVGFRGRPVLVEEVQVRPKCRGIVGKALYQALERLRLLRAPAHPSVELCQLFGQLRLARKLVAERSHRIDRLRESALVAARARHSCESRAIARSRSDRERAPRTSSGRAGSLAVNEAAISNARPAASGGFTSGSAIADATSSSWSACAAEAARKASIGVDAGFVSPCTSAPTMASIGFGSERTRGGAYAVGDVGSPTEVTCAEVPSVFRTRTLAAAVSVRATSR